MEANKNIFLKAIVVVIALFAIALFVGYTLESDNYASTENSINQLNSNLESSLLFLMFMQTHNQTASMCNVLQSQLDDSAQAAYSLSNTLAQAQATDVFVSYDDLTTRYFLANMQFYLMLREDMQTCGNATFSPVLFFYSAYNSCPSCVAQGQVLDQVRAECSNARVFAFPADAQNISMIKYFTQYYNVTQTPALVINDELHNELLSKAKIEALINCTN
jgi:hypothetical protein